MKRVKPYHTGNMFSLCQFCAHAKRDKPWQCEAYPDEIPLEITNMNVDHRVPYLDDNGVQFKLREDMEPIWYEWFLRDFFVDTWTRTEEEVRREKEEYAEQIKTILARRRLTLLDNG